MNRPQKGRCAIVSGAASGIGRACARTLAAQGFSVAVNYRRHAERAEQTVALCRRAGADAVAVQGDVADDDACRRLVELAVARWGGVDALVNNAGVTRFAAAGDLEALSREDFEQIMAVNVTGAYQLTRAAAPHLERADAGAVVNVSSHSGLSGLGSSTAYAASKGALNTMTLSLARALAPRVRVNAVCPGFVDTDWMAGAMGREELDAFKRRAARIAPLERLVSAQDVAEAVGWLVTGARSITGQLLVIDGGTHLTVGSPV